MKYTKEFMLSKVDHTLLKPEATWPQIQTLCDEAIANHCASVCINTCYVKQAVEYMDGRVPVCCVVGFPLGAMDTRSKAFEAKTAVENGASEVDMVINIGWLKNKQYDDVRADIAAVKAAVGDLDLVKCPVKVTCFVASTPDFYAQPQVANGGTQLLIDLWGQEDGAPSRSATVFPMVLPPLPNSRLTVMMFFFIKTTSPWMVSGPCAPGCLLYYTTPGLNCASIM